MSDENGELTKEQLQAEVKILTTWVIGFVIECEGCMENARSWVEGLGEITTNEHAGGT